MTQEAKHTPTPWKVYYAKNNGKIILGTGEENGCAIQAHNGSFWRDEEEAKANAEFVVKACNNHYNMLEALEKIAQAMEDNMEVPDYIFKAINRARGFEE